MSTKTSVAKIKYTDEPIKAKVIRDFLAPPEEMAFREEDVKITIAELIGVQSFIADGSAVKKNELRHEFTQSVKRGSAKSTDASMFHGLAAESRVKYLNEEPKLIEESRLAKASKS